MRILVYLSLTLLLWSCQNNTVVKPDVSGVKVGVQIQRFEKDFFAIDSNQIQQALTALEKKYPGFTSIYIGNILGLGPISDNNPLAYRGAVSFLKVSRPVYDTAMAIYPDMDGVSRELSEAFKYVKHYFPGYTLPSRVITMVGPMDALPPLTTNERTACILGNDFIAIGLQFYLGKNYSIYNDPGFITNLVPLYRSRRFSREYITSDVMKVIADDLYPDNSNGKAMIVQMIEKGKRWWLLNKLLPETPDSIKTGFTQYQLEGCYQNEAAIWQHFREAVDLFTIEPDVIKNYIGDAAFCLPLSQEAPGNIGTWVGYRIVTAYEEKHPGIGIDSIMKTDARKILDDSRYKPQ